MIDQLILNINWWSVDRRIAKSKDFSYARIMYSLESLLVAPIVLSKCTQLKRFASFSGQNGQPIALWLWQVIPKWSGYDHLWVKADLTSPSNSVPWITLRLLLLFYFCGIIKLKNDQCRHDCGKQICVLHLTTTYDRWRETRLVGSATYQQQYIFGSGLWVAKSVLNNFRRFYFNAEFDVDFEDCYQTWLNFGS